jgi:hypothetical protein
MATNRPTIDSQGYKSREGLIIEAVCDRSLKKEFALAVWNKCLSQKFLRSSSYQKKLLVHVM